MTVRPTATRVCDGGLLGAVSLAGASFVLGLASVAVWTFGQELVADSTDKPGWRLWSGR